MLSLLFAYLLTRIEYDASHAGLALATSIAAILNAWLLYRGLRRNKIVQHGAGWGVLLLRIMAANAAMVAVILYFERPLQFWLGAGTLVKAGWLGLTVAASAVVYFVILWLVGVRPAHIRLRSVE